MLPATRLAISIILFVAVTASSVRAASDEVSTVHAWASKAWLGKSASTAQPASGFEQNTPPFSFVYAGAPSFKFLASWRVATSQTPLADGREKHAITYTDPATGLQVVCELTLFSDFPAADWVLHLHNAGNADTPIIESLRPLDLGIVVPADGKVVLHRSNGSRLEPVDFLPSDQAVEKRANIRLTPNGGRSSDGVLPFFGLQWPRGGLVGAIGWSGQWAMQLCRDAADRVTLQAGQQTVRLTLHPGESMRTPRILLVSWQGDDQTRGHNLFRRLLMAHYLPRRNGEIAIAPTASLGWWSFGGGDAYDEANQLAWIGKLAKTGLECYWMDAGWFDGGFPNGVGNWRPKAKNFPNGLKPLGDAAHREGKKFVLWFEPERVNPDSRIAKEHPEWVLHADPKKRQFDVFHPGDGLFNLGNPAARQWLASRLSQCVQDWGIDVLRIDFNIDPLCFWNTADSLDRQGMTEIRYVEGLYQLWDELIRRHPSLTIDNCASGGRRIDLETVSRSYPLWRSDTGCLGPNSKPIGDQIQVAGLSLYVPQHCGGIWGFDPYTFRSAATMGGTFCGDLRANEFPQELVRQATEEIKTLRPLYFGDYYPLFEINSSEEAWAGWQFDRPELGRGFAVVFRRSKCPKAFADLKPQGLDPHATYNVEFRETYAVKETRTIKGAELAKLRVQISSAPGSLLIVYRKI
jgi:alpha-galactosidase